MSHEDPSDGLALFKKGWATESRTVHLCGRIFDRQKYEQLIEAGNIGETAYFPAYREGELA